jgi:hypothetical protein
MNTGTDIVNYDKAWSDQAEAAAAQHQVKGGLFLSTKGGILSLGDEVMPGNQACVIILDDTHENTFYGGKYMPDNIQPPVCYAFGRAGDEMAPHPSMQVDLSYFQPQAATCGQCPHNVYGSADVGRGKACQNRYRLQLIPAGFYQQKRGSRDFDLELFTAPADFQTTDVVSLKLPVTSTSLYDKYVTQVSGMLRRPPHGVITRIHLEPHAKFQYQVHFEMIEPVPNELAQIVMGRHDAQTRAPFQGYAPPREQEPAAPAGSLRGLRR